MKEAPDLQTKLLNLYQINATQVVAITRSTWYLPTAIVTVNLAALHSFATAPLVLFALWIFNCAAIYVFWSYVEDSRPLISAAKANEKALRKFFRDGVPQYSTRRPRTANVVLITLICLNLAFLAYVAVLFLRKELPLCGT